MNMKSLWKKKICFGFVFGFVMAFILLIPAQESMAASIKTKIKTVSFTSVKISCTCGKGISRWKVRQEMKKSNGSTYYKTIKTLKKKQKSYTVKHLKKNRNYSFEIIGYSKKKGKLSPVIYDYCYGFTGVSEVKWYDYALSDAYCSPERIDLMWSDANNGFKSSGYEIYRRKKGEKSFKKIATITKKSTTTYKDKKVEAGVAYQYRMRAFGKVKGKKKYSPYTEVMTRSAVYLKGTYSSEVISRDKDKLVMKIDSKLYNGDLDLTGKSLDLCGTASDPDADEDGFIGIICPTSYSEDGKNWTALGENDKVVLEGGKTIYLTFEGKNGLDLTKGSSVKSDSMTYNHLPSFWDIIIGGSGEAWYNMEKTH